MAAPAGNGERRRSRFASMEFIGEVILLVAVGAFLVYMYLDSVDNDAGGLAWLPWRLDWGDGGWLLPRIAVFFSVPFWIWRAASLFRAGASSDPGQIMDTGFLDTTDSRNVVALRWVQLFGTTAALLLGVWIIGFHIAVPAYTVLYLIIFGKAKWYWTIIPAVFILIVVNFIYGYLLIAEWGNPVARDWPIVGSIWDAAVNAWHSVYDSLFDPNA